MQHGIPLSEFLDDPLVVQPVILAKIRCAHLLDVRQWNTRLCLLPKPSRRRHDDTRKAMGDKETR